MFLFPLHLNTLLFRNQNLSGMCVTSGLCKSTSTWWSGIRDDERLLYDLDNYLDSAQENNFEGVWLWEQLNFIGFSSKIYEF